MDRKLLAWGLRHKASGLPRLWLFTDDKRLPDPLASAAALPRGRAGVVLRHDNDPARLAIGRDLARICRDRRLVLVVAGDARLAATLHAGLHLREGRWTGPFRKRAQQSERMRDARVFRRLCVVTSSAHSVRTLRTAGAIADLVFLSPAFPTASHAGAPGLGPLRWAAMARRGGARRGGALRDEALLDGPIRVGALRGGVGRIAALGGLDGDSVRRLPPGLLSAVGAIGALCAD